MADTKISALTSVTTPLAGTEELPAVQSSTTKKTTVNDFFDRAVTINESGANADFRVEGDTRTHLLFVDASTDRVGINIDTPTERLDVDGNIRFGGARTDATRKLATLAGPHYTAAEEDFLALRVDAQSGGNVLSIGGSSAAHNAATYVDIYTAANKTTVTGTLALQVDPSQNVSVKTGNLVIGTSGKGISTGSAIPLGFGTNGSTSQATIGTSGELSLTGTVQSTKVGIQNQYTTYGNRFEITDTRSGLTAATTPFLRFSYGNGKASAIIRVVVAGTRPTDDEIACTLVWLATRREGSGTSFTITNVESQGINTGAITLTENGRNLELNYVKGAGTSITAWTYVEFIGMSMLSGANNPITATVL